MTTRKCRRVACVTGASRGIGRAIALRLAEAGMDIAVHYRRDRDGALGTAAAARELGVEAEVFAADIGGPDGDASLPAALLDRFGRVDVFVSNAGIASRGLSAEQTTRKEYERVMASHAFGPIGVLQPLLAPMRSGKRGDVIFISSAATTTMPVLGAPYNMAKAAVEALARTMAHEERPHGIRVNIVAPGLVDTDMGRRLVRAREGLDDIRELDQMYPFGRVCQPEDVAGVVAWLVSEAGSYVTGERVQVDGGGVEGLSQVRDR